MHSVGRINRIGGGDSWNSTIRFADGTLLKDERVSQKWISNIFHQSWQNPILIFVKFSSFTNYPWKAIFITGGKRKIRSNNNCSRSAEAQCFLDGGKDSRKDSLIKLNSNDQARRFPRFAIMKFAGESGLAADTETLGLGIGQSVSAFSLAG